MIRNINGKPYFPAIHLGKPCQEAEGSSQSLQLKLLGVSWASASSPPKERQQVSNEGTSPLRAVQWSHCEDTWSSEKRGLWRLDQGTGLQMHSWKCYKLFYWAVEDADRSHVPGARDGFPLTPTPSDTHMHTPICTHTDPLAPEPGLEL